MYYSDVILKIIFFSMHLLPRDEFHAWIHLYAASPGARNTEQAKITKWKIIAHGRIPHTARYKAYKSTTLTAHINLDFYECRNQISM